MKTIILLAAFFCCLSVSATGPQLNTSISVREAIPPTSFSFIRGHKQGKNQAVNWGMTNNAGISHFIVECTYEDPYDPYSVWRTVGMIPCTPRTPIFKIIDNPFLPGTLNYRVIAVMNNGSTITSDLYTIYI